MRFPGGFESQGVGMAARWLNAQCPVPGSRAVRAMRPPVHRGAAGPRPALIPDSAGRRWAARVAR